MCPFSPPESDNASVLDTPEKKRQLQYHQRRAKSFMLQKLRVDTKLDKLQQEPTLDVEEELSSDFISIVHEEDRKIQDIPRGTSKTTMGKKPQVKTNSILD